MKAVCTLAIASRGCQPAGARLCEKEALKEKLSTIAYE
jgi:hypothetical protein